jgi:hypothetical protein
MRLPRLPASFERGAGAPKGAIDPHQSAGRAAGRGAARRAAATPRA